MEPAPETLVGQKGSYKRGGVYGRAYSGGFIVIAVYNDNLIEVEFDKPILLNDEKHSRRILHDDVDGPYIPYIPEEKKYRILQYRRPGRWIFKGVPANKMVGHILMGESETLIEDGIF